MEVNTLPCDSTFSNTLVCVTEPPYCAKETPKPISVRKK